MSFPYFVFLRLYNNGVFTTTGFKKGSKFSGRKSGRIKEYHEWYFVMCKKNLPQIEFATWFATYFAFHSRKTKMGFQCQQLWFAHCDTFVDLRKLLWGNLWKQRNILYKIYLAKVEHPDLNLTLARKKVPNNSCLKCYTKPKPPEELFFSIKAWRIGDRLMA